MPSTGPARRAVGRPGRCGRPVGVVVAGLSLAMALVAAATATSAAPVSAVSSSSAVSVGSAAPAPCRPVWLFTAAGTGADVVGAVSGPLAERLGARLRVVPTPPPAAGASYAAAHQEAVGSLSTTVSDVATRCPDARLMLVGFSEGAHVAGDLASRIGTGQERGIPPERVVAVGLFGDPARSPFTRVVPSEAGGQGVLPARAAGFGSLDPRTIEICAPRDPVCDSPAQAAFPSLEQALKAPEHASYPQLPVARSLTATQWAVDSLAKVGEAAPAAPAPAPASPASPATPAAPPGGAAPATVATAPGSSTAAPTSPAPTSLPGAGLPADPAATGSAATTTAAPAASTTSAAPAPTSGGATPTDSGGGYGSGAATASAGATAADGSTASAGASAPGDGQQTTTSGGAQTTTSGGAQTTTSGGAQTTTSGGAQTTTSGGAQSTTSGGAQSTTSGGAQSTTSGGAQSTTSGGAQTTTSGGAQSTTSGGAPASTTTAAGGAATSTSGGAATSTSGGAQQTTTSSGSGSTATSGGAEQGGAAEQEGGTDPTGGVGDTVFALAGTSGFDLGQGGNVENGEVPVAVASPNVPGRQAVKMELPAGGKRSEVRPDDVAQDIRPGERLFFGYSAFLPQDFPTDFQGFQVIWQLHDGETNTSPPVALEIQQGKLWLANVGELVQDLGPVSPGENVTVEMEIEFAIGGGTVSLSRDGKQVLDRFAPPKGTMIDGFDFLKTGIYREEQGSPPVSLFLNDLKVGDTKESVGGLAGAQGG